MTTLRFTNLLVCASVASLLTACGNPDGYYDSKGNYISTNTAHSDARADRYERDYRTDNRTNDYNRTDYGYYDDDSRYIAGGSYAPSNGVNIPSDMMPSRGMCRVWFADRAAADQPPIESCKHIKSRVPAGAFVVYGG